MLTPEQNKAWTKYQAKREQRQFTNCLNRRITNFEKQTKGLPCGKCWYCKQEQEKALQYLEHLKHAE